MQSRKMIGGVLGCIVAIVALAVLLKEKTQNITSDVPATKLQVVATFFPLYDFTRNIAKDKINLSLLFTQTPEVAAFTPADIRKINNADLVIKNGLGFEVVLDDLLKASDNKNVAVVDVSEHAELLTAADEHEGPNDPHIWLDPQNVMKEVETIVNALIIHDPENAEFYRRNADAYILQLRTLDTKIQSDVAGYRSKDFVSFHSAFQYFAHRYGLNQVAVIEEFPGKEPSPAYIAGVIDLIRRKRISAIFSEPQFSPKVVEVIAHDLGLTVRALDPIETGDIERDSYISRMRINMATLKEALQ